MRILALIAGFALLFWTAATSLTQINPGQVGVVRRFGRILPDRPAPGLHVGLPWGIDVLERVDVSQVRTVNIGFDPKEADKRPAEAQLLTGDHNLVNVQARLDYRVLENEVDRFLIHRLRVDDVVARVAESVLAEWIGARPVDQVLGEEKINLPRWLVQETNRRLERYELGIRIEQASLAKLFPPDEVRASFDEVTSAKTSIETSRNAAKQTAEEKLSKAEGDRIRIVRAAESTANSEVLNARSEARNFEIRLAQYRELSKKQPNLLAVLWREDMTRLYARMRATGRIDLLDHYLDGEGLTITHIPNLSPPKKR